jgi:hypothetical protein
MNSMNLVDTDDRHTYEDIVFTKVSGSPYIQGKLYDYMESMEDICTKNENGIFLNLSAISYEILLDIYHKIAHIENTQETYIEKNVAQEITENNVSVVTTVKYQPFQLTKFQKRLLNLISS